MTGVCAQSGFGVPERVESFGDTNKGRNARSKKRDSNGLTQLHRDVLAYIDGRASVDYCDIAAHFGFSPPRACLLINILAQRGMLIRSMMVLTPLGVSARS